ncbi:MULTISPECIES: PEPxxWA-CTERM sorting domain-containing protein [unclassified Phenylobacterium]|uniref:PEPxxWA-CTERM sorting domain-containing protein n=1 Tax=unclassified Phenylobacterium TaxID=2640670 RepID=UPI00083A010D|nr:MULTISPECIES: PEPxxWA-CTERM sorting domain-containing protein [unclassified Phenylobacterium]
MTFLRTALTALSAAIAIVATPVLAATPLKPTLSWQTASTPLPADMFMIDNFDAPITAGFTFTGGMIRLGSQGTQTNVSVPPPGDLTKYVTILGGKSATLTSVKPLRKLSLYMGSPDSYNSIRFIGEGYDFTLQGSQLWQPLSATLGDPAWGRRLTYDFGSFGVTQVVFASARNSLEFDDLAGAFQAAPVPEPASWALMIFGFLGSGAMLRRRQQAAHLA